MANPITNTYRLARAGLTLTYYGVALFPSHIPTPWPVKLARIVFFPIRLIGAVIRAPFGSQSTSERLVTALTGLGPSYIKLGQFLATRSDIIGKELANDLSALHDRLPPFSEEEAKAEIERQLGEPFEKHFTDLGPAIAAASIAQVHRAKLKHNGGEKPVAVKILRPHIEKRFQKDQDSYGFAARMIERFSKPARRLRPVEVVKTLDRTMEIELDLRLEAAAISELAENTKNDPNFGTPKVDWTRTTKRLLVTDWIEGTPISDHEKLREQGHNLEVLGTHVLQTFLRQAMRDGFFHADMHPGNLLVDKEGNLIAVDMGIMGRLTAKEQRFLAQILHGFITGDYIKAAEAHFEAGYVPSTHSVAEFAQGLRAIGEPIADRPAEEISMARFLGQLFEYTAVYDMATRPELILLQKNLVLAEGVARELNPKLNMWRAAEPVVKEWLENQLGPRAKLKTMATSLKAIDKQLDHLPEHIENLSSGLSALSKLGKSLDGLDEQTIAKLFTKNGNNNHATTLALWIIALSLAAIAFALLF